MRTKEQEQALYSGLRPAVVAEALDCSREHVVSLIRSGALDAVNIAQTTEARPEYRVSRESFEAFLKARQVA